MNIYNDVRGGFSCTAMDLINQARAELDLLTDSGDQLHRRAVLNKPLFALSGGKQRNGQYWSGYSVSIRVQGQYSDKAKIIVGSSELAKSLVREISDILKNDPIGITEE